MAWSSWPPLVEDTEYPGPSELLKVIRPATACHQWPVTGCHQWPVTGCHQWPVTGSWEDDFSY
jgi:hypothetical protein